MNAFRSKPGNPSSARTSTSMISSIAVSDAARAAVSFSGLSTCLSVGSVRTPMDERIGPAPQGVAAGPAGSVIGAVRPRMSLLNRGTPA